MSGTMPTRTCSISATAPSGRWAASRPDIGMGDDGNYYLYDAQFPNVAVQLTFVQNVGEDQAGADQDDSDEDDQ